MWLELSVQDCIEDLAVGGVRQGEVVLELGERLEGEGGGGGGGGGEEKREGGGKGRGGGKEGKGREGVEKEWGGVEGVKEVSSAPCSGSP